MYTKCFNCSSTVRIPDDKWCTPCSVCDCVAFATLEPGFKYVEKMCNGHHSVFKVEGDEVVHCMYCKKLYKAGDFVMFKRSGQEMYSFEELYPWIETEVQPPVFNLNNPMQKTKNQAILNGISFIEFVHSVTCEQCSTTNCVNLTDNVSECRNCRNTILAPPSAGYRYAEFTCCGNRDFYHVQDDVPFFRCKVCFEVLRIGERVISKYCGQDVYNAQSCYERVLSLEEENKDLKKENQMLWETSIADAEKEFADITKEAGAENETMEKSTKTQPCDRTVVNSEVHNYSGLPFNAECENCSTTMHIEDSKGYAYCDCGELVLSSVDPGKKYMVKMCQGISTVFLVEEGKAIRCKYCSHWYTAGNEVLWTRCGIEVYNCVEVVCSQRNETDSENKTDYIDSKLSAQLQKSNDNAKDLRKEVEKLKQNQKNSTSVWAQEVNRLEDKLYQQITVNKKLEDCNLSLLKKIANHTCDCKGNVPK